MGAFSGRGSETPGGCTVAAALRPSLTHPLLNPAGLPLDLQYLPADKQREPEADVRKMLLETLLLVGGQVGWGGGYVGDALCPGACQVGPGSSFLWATELTHITIKILWGLPALPHKPL